MENLLTVSALRTTVEAELIRGKLEAAGIPAVLVEPQPAAEEAVAGRVQVQVSQPDFERAMQLLFPIPKITPAARPARPPWRCPNCGEQVLGSFPQCPSCGTPREGPPPETALPAVGQPPPSSFPPLPAMPPGPIAPMPAAPLTPSAPQMPSAPPSAPQMPAPMAAAPPEPFIAAVPPVTAPPEVSAMPFAEVPPAPRLELPPRIAAPAMNGESSDIGVSPPPRRLTRTAEEDGLKIVVPAWSPNTPGSGGGRAAQRRGPTDADDRAARRAWWCAVFGMVIWPLLIYSIGVVLILGLSNRPLSVRGTRFFYGALALNALFIAAVFAFYRMRV